MAVRLVTGRLPSASQALAAASSPWTSAVCSISQTAHSTTALAGSLRDAPQKAIILIEDIDVAFVERGEVATDGQSGGGGGGGGGRGGGRGSGIKKSQLLGTAMLNAIDCSVA